MPTFEVVIIGGGPSGLRAAKTAAEEGAKTLVLEMRASIGPHASFPMVLSHPPKGTANRVYADRILFSSRNTQVEAKCSRFAIVDSSEFLRKMASEAIDAGAEIWISSPVQTPRTSSSRITKLTVQGPSWKEDVRANVVLDASGFPPWSAPLLSGASSSEPLVDNCYLIPSTEIQQPRVFFSSYHLPGGFGWAVPAFQALVSVGVRGERPQMDIALDELCGSIFQQKPPVPIAARRSLHPSSGPVSELVREKLGAVGSAAGWFAPLAFGSLRYSMISGEIAGKLAAESISTPHALSYYPTTCDQQCGMELRKYFALYGALVSLRDPELDAFLSVLQRHSLGRAFADLFVCRTPHRALERLLTNDEVRSVLKLPTP